MILHPACLVEARSSVEADGMEHDINKDLIALLLQQGHRISVQTLTGVHSVTSAQEAIDLCKTHKNAALPALHDQNAWVIDGGAWSQCLDQLQPFMTRPVAELLERRLSDAVLDESEA